MLSNVIMVAGTACLLGAFFYRRQEEFHKQLFKDLQRCPKYHSDYLEDSSHLPLNTPLILFGPAQSTSSSQKIISSSFITKSKEQQRFWKFRLNNPFVLKTASNQDIQVNTGQQVYAFNLPPTNRELKNPKYEERAIMHGLGVSIYGKVQQIETKRQIVPQIVIGNKHQSILLYLDNLIMKSSQKGKIFAGAGTLILCLHFFSKQKKYEIKEELEKFK